MQTFMHYFKTTDNFQAVLHSAIPESLTFGYAGRKARPSASAHRKTANLSQVDLSSFLRLKAKIDAVTFSCWENDLAPSQMAVLRSVIKDGRLERRRGRKGEDFGDRVWLAVHDPSLRDLKKLVERFWNSHVLRIEIAVDAHLQHGSNELWRLDALKAQLRHCLLPQRHQRLGKALRKRFDVTRKRYRNDGLGTALPATQIIWESPDCADQLALYIKTRDNGCSVGQPWVRMEARLRDSGPAAAGVGRLGMLPHFAKSLRAYLAPMFWIAADFKNEDELRGRGIPADPWATWGAQWSAAGKARLRPNTEANKLVGQALNELCDSLGRIPPPTAVAARYTEWIEDLG